MPQFDYEIGEAKERDPNAPSRFQPLPRNDYECIVIDTKIKETKAGTGKYLEVTLQVVDGPASGRRLWDRLNISNPSKDAEEQAKKQLDCLCAAVGLTHKMQQTEQLHDIPILVSVDIDRKDETRNRIIKDGYAKLGGGTSSKPEPSVAAKKPWER
jgi:hypothetical protein